jgi:Putative auto-transporter adhesin, head GIN domain
MRNFHTSRRCLLALPASIAIASMASLAWALRPGSGQATPTLATEERPVAGFDELTWDASGELTIEQTGRERLLIEAEPHVLRHIVTRVRDGRLEIGFAPGRVETTLPIRFKLELRQLRRLELRGSGQATAGALRADELTLALHGTHNLRIGALNARRVDLRHAGAGDVRIDGGRVDTQRIVLEGSGTVDATALAARSSDVLLTGAGEVRLAAEHRLAARIDGSGDIVYRGRPQVSQVIHGAGDVRRSEP